MAKRKGFTVTDEMEDALRDLTEETKIPESVHLREAVKEYLERKGKKVEADIRWGGNRRKRETA